MDEPNQEAPAQEAPAAAPAEEPSTDPAAGGAPAEKGGFMKWLKGLFGKKEE